MLRGFCVFCILLFLLILWFVMLFRFWLCYFFWCCVVGFYVWFAFVSLSPVDVDLIFVLLFYLALFCWLGLMRVWCVFGSSCFS